MITAFMRANLSGLDRVEKEMPEVAQTATGDMAEAVRRDIEANWYPTSPSPPGGPPAKVTGALERSVRFWNRDRSGRFASGENVYSTTIRYDEIYAARLEFDIDRAFLQPALDRMAPQYGGIFAAVARRRIK